VFTRDRYLDSMLTCGEFAELFDIGGFADVLEEKYTVTSVVFEFDMMLIELPDKL
jgi:hypothetical protein